MKYLNLAHLETDWRSKMSNCCWKLKEFIFSNLKDYIEEEKLENFSVFSELSPEEIIEDFKKYIKE